MASLGSFGGLTSDRREREHGVGRGRGFVSGRSGSDVGSRTPTSDSFGADLAGLTPLKGRTIPFPSPPHSVASTPL